MNIRSLNIRSLNYKKIIGVVVLIAWIIFSAIYIANDKWQDLQTISMQQARQQGVSDTVRALITESAKCAPVSLMVGDKKTEVIAVSCISADKNVTEKK